MATSNVITLHPGRDRGEPLSQIHDDLAVCQATLRCATAVFEAYEHGRADVADFGQALLVAQRCERQLDRLVDRVDEWSVAHHRELPAGA